MSDDTAKTPRRWGRILLIGSLAFNLLIVGLIAGTLLSGPRDRDRNPLLRDLGFGPFVHALPRRSKIELTEALKREAGSLRDNRAELRRHFEAFLAALRADPYEPDETARLIADQRGRIGERQAIGQALLLEHIATMSAEERAAYADALDSALRRPRHRH